LRSRALPVCSVRVPATSRSSERVMASSSEVPRSGEPEYASSRPSAAEYVPASGASP